MRKFLAVLLSVAMVLGVAGCGSSNSSTKADDTKDAATTEAASDIKVGFIFIGDENETYTYAHVLGAKEMQEALGLSDDQIIYKWNIPENEQ